MADVTELENTYDWQPPLIMAGLPVVLITGWLALLRRPGWEVIGLTLLFVWIMYAFQIWLRTRAKAAFDDEGTLHVRRFFTTKQVRVGEVVQVRQVVNGRSPDLALKTTHGTTVVPSSKLHGGHSQLFLWFEECQPDATFDKGAEKIRTRLRAGGYLDGTRALTADQDWQIKDFQPGLWNHRGPSDV